MSCWLISVPNEGKSSDETFNHLKNELASSKHDHSQCFHFDLPSDLLVGTLASLMGLSDELTRIDMIVENVVRKIERQYHDLNKGEDVLTVDGVPVDRYVNYFSWDEAKHPHRRPLSEIANIIQSNICKVEDELKQLSGMYQDKKSQLQQKQKKNGNAATLNLDEIITPKIVTGKEFVNTDYLTTFIIIVPKTIEQQFLTEYHKIGDDIVDYSNKKKGDCCRGSPVVPESAKRLLEEGDSVYYTITVLKGHYERGRISEDTNTFVAGHFHDYTELFKQRARDKKYIVREFAYNPNAFKENEQKMASLEIEVDRLYSGLIRWTKSHFGEAFIAFLHIKAIRVFVESVLRYGLPVNMTTVLLRPHKGKDKKVRMILDKLYGHLQPSQFAKIEESSTGGSATTNTTTDYFPYVCNVFSPLTIV